MIAGLAMVLGTSMSLDIRSTLAVVDTMGEGYYGSVSYHGIIMIFFFMMPLLFGGIGNAIIPTMTGMSDMILPRLNSVGLFILGDAFLIAISAVVMDSTVSMGWTMYPPIVTIQSNAIDALIVSLHLAGISSIVLAINSIVTTFESTPAGIYAEQLPLVLWSTNIANALLIIALPVLAAGITMLLLDRNCNTEFFMPGGGTELILYQHIFWFFGHPEVYVLILPAFGYVSHLIQNDMSGNILNPSAMIIALLSIGFVSCVVWAHHMYTVGLDADMRAYFTYATFLIAVPTGVKYFTWIASIMNAAFLHSIPTHSVAGFLWFFAFGGLTGVILANGGLDLMMHDTYYVIGHFHIVMAVALAFALVGMLVHLSGTLL